MDSQGLGSLEPVLGTADGEPAEDIYGASDVQRMKQAYINEKTCPELLEFETDLVDRVTTQIHYQEQRVQDLDKHPDTALQRCMYLTELDRVKFALRCYYRTRLYKIEAFVMSLLDTADVSDPAGPTHPLLSPKELRYTQEYFVAHGTHMRENVLGRLPEGFQELTQQSEASTPKDTFPGANLDKHIFCRVLEDRGTVDLGNDGLDTADFQKGDLYIVRYRPVQQLLKDKWIALI